MATRRSTAQQKSAPGESRLPLPSLRLPSPLRREVFGVLSIVIGLLSGIALVSPNGTVSGLWQSVLVDLFGWMAPLPALAFVVLGIQLIRRRHYPRAVCALGNAHRVGGARAGRRGLWSSGSGSAGNGRKIPGRRRHRPANPKAADHRAGLCGSSCRPLCPAAHYDDHNVLHLVGTHSRRPWGIWQMVRLVGKGLGVLFAAAAGVYRRLGDAVPSPWNLRLLSHARLRYA